MRKHAFFLILVPVILLTTACTRKIIKSPDASEILVYPPPPNLPRVQFLTYIRNSDDIVRSPSWFHRFFLGKEKPKPIMRPYGLHVGGDILYVCDPGIQGLEIINLREHRFTWFRPTGIGQLRMPLNCAVDDSGYLYVADAYRRQVVVYDAGLQYVTAFGEEENFKPVDVAFLKDRIYVTNLEGRNVCVYERKDKKLLFTFPDAQKGEEAFLYKPTTLHISEDMIYVTDFGEVRIKIYDAAGKYLKAVGSYGRNPGQMVRPKGITTDQDRNLYVVDAAFENVQLFNPEGHLLMAMGGAGNMNLPAGIALSRDNLDTFREYLYKDYEMLFLIFVANQYGPDKIGVYAFIRKIK